MSIGYNKKGLYFATLTVVVIIIFVISYNIYLVGKEKSVALEDIGLRASSSLNSFYEAEKIKYYIDESAKYSAINAIFLMGENGGIYDKEDCMQDDYVVLNENCELNPEEDFKKFFNDNFNKYLNEYNIKAEDFELTLNDNFKGVSKKNLELGVEKALSGEVKFNIKRADDKTAPYIEIIKKYSSEYNIPENLIISIITQESTGNRYAVSRVGAAGLMQLMPTTAKGLGLKNTIYSCSVAGDYTSCECIAAEKDSCDYENDERFNPERNLYAGITYLKNLHDTYNDDELALAAYNWGPDNVNKNCDLDEGFSSCKNVPAENNNYVNEVMERYKLLNTGEIYSSIQGFIWPVEGYNYISSCFGNRGYIGEHASVYHPGIDIPVPENTPVMAVADGVISLIDEDWGRIVIDQSNGISTEYLHLKSIAKKDGNVMQGEIIGYSGDKKAEGNYHLHFGVINTNIDSSKYNENEIILTSFNERQYVNPTCYFNLKYKTNPDSLSCQCNNNVCELNEGPTKWCNYYGSAQESKKIGSYYFKPEFLVDLNYNLDDFNQAKEVAENWVNGNCGESQENCALTDYSIERKVAGNLMLFEFKSKEKLYSIQQIIIKFALPIKT